MHGPWHFSLLEFLPIPAAKDPCWEAASRYRNADDDVALRITRSCVEQTIVSDIHRD